MSLPRQYVRHLYRFLGQPNYLRWLQWSTIFSLLEARDDSLIIDLGAGPMQYAIWLKKKTNARVVAVDRFLPPEGVKLARRQGIAIVCADGQALPLADSSVDRILMSSLLHMVPDPEQLLAECRRVLKLDGYLVLSVPNHYQFIPAVFAGERASVWQKLFGLPDSQTELTTLLNKRFLVGGPKGYYSMRELTELIEKCSFRIEKHRYRPGRVGSFLWELGVLAYVRLGSLAFHLLFLTYPLARVADVLSRNKQGSEHIVKVSPIHEN